MLEKRKFNSIFDLFFNDLEENFFSSELDFKTRMKLNVEELEESYLVTSELAGVDKKDIKIEIKDDVLKLEVEKDLNNEKDNKKYILKETFSGKLIRSIKLNNLDSNSVDASFENGILSIKIGKLKNKQKKNILIK